MRKYEAFLKAIRLLLLGLIIILIVLVFKPSLATSIVLGAYGAFATAVSTALITFVTGNIKAHKLGAETNDKPA